MKIFVNVLVVIFAIQVINQECLFVVHKIPPWVKSGGVVGTQKFYLKKNQIVLF